MIYYIWSSLSLDRCNVNSYIKKTFATIGSLKGYRVSMQISMKCSIAVHCLIFMHEAKGIAKVTSNLLAESTGSNPVVIRNILSALKKAGLITVARGTGGAELCVDPSRITLYQIYSALEPGGVTSIIGIHPCQDRPCPMAQNIQKVLRTPYHKIENAVKETMEQITLQSMIEEFHGLVSGN